MPGNAQLTPFADDGYHTMTMLSDDQHARRASTAVLAGGLVLTAVYFVLPGWAQAVLLLGMVTTALLVLAARLHRESLLWTRPWNYLLAGVGLYTVATFVWRLVPSIIGRPLGFPSLLDAAYFATYFLYACFLLGVLRRRYADSTDAPRGLALSLVDAGIFACAGMALLWPVLMPAVVPDVSAAAFLAAVAYPLLTAIVVGLAVQLFSSPPRVRRAELLLAMWVGGELAAAVLYGYLSAAGTFSFGHPITVGWLVSYTALAALALHPLFTRQPAAPVAVMGTRQVWSWLLWPVVLVPLGVAAMIALVTGGLEPLTRAVLYGLASAGVMLLVARLHLLSGDLAEQRRLARDLAASEERTRSIIRTAVDAYIEFDRHGRVTDWNPQAETTFGWSREEAIGRGLTTLIIPPHLRQSYGQRLSALSAQPSLPTEPLERSVVDRSGREFPVEIMIWAIQPGHLFAVFARDVSERHALERTKEEFVSVVSHELRTPLTSIHGSLGLLRSGVLGELSDRGQRMIDIAVGNTERLVRLVNDILDIERLDSGEAPLQRRACDAVTLVDDAVEVMAGLADQAGVRLDVDVQPARLCADPDRVHQTLVNLLSNAIKFSPAGGTVWVSAQPDGRELVVRVGDEGPGIPGDQLESVFGRFQQVDASDSRAKGGTGLGLAICRTIAEQHGGRIWADSQPGEGTVVTLVLPLGPCNCPPDDPSAGEPHRLVTSATDAGGKDTRE